MALLFMISKLIMWHLDLLFDNSTVFHVTDLDGNKITDEGVISYIEKVNIPTPNFNYYVDD